MRRWEATAVGAEEGGTAVGREEWLTAVQLEMVGEGGLKAVQMASRRGGVASRYATVDGKGWLELTSCTVEGEVWPAGMPQ